MAAVHDDSLCCKLCYNLFNRPVGAALPHCPPLVTRWEPEFFAAIRGLPCALSGFASLRPFAVRRLCRPFGELRYRSRGLRLIDRPFQAFGLNIDGSLIGVWRKRS